MTKAFTIHALNKEGFHVELTGTYPEEYDLTVGRLIDPDYGFGPYVGPAATTAPAGGTTEAVDPALACQFCGKGVTGTPKIGSNGPYTAAEVARSRANKMEKLGKEAKPVCGNCWNKAGWKQKWDAFYNSNS